MIQEGLYARKKSSVQRLAGLGASQGLSRVPPAAAAERFGVLGGTIRAIAADSISQDLLNCDADPPVPAVLLKSSSEC